MSDRNPQAAVGQGPSGPVDPVSDMLAAIRDVLSLPLPAPTVAAGQAYHSERELRADAVRSWCDDFLTKPALTPAEVADALRGLREQRAVLTYATWADWEYVQGQIAEQVHQVFDPSALPLAVAR